MNASKSAPKGLICIKHAVHKHKHFHLKKSFYKIGRTQRRWMQQRIKPLPVPPLATWSRLRGK